MSDHDEQVNLTEGLAGAPSSIGWSPEANPVESFTSTIEHALQQLSLELAAIRAERDGLRLELEGLRAQCELLRSQLQDRDRFQATVRELSDIVRKLNVPASWTSTPTPPPPPRAEPMVPLVGSDTASPAPVPQAIAEPSPQAAPEPAQEPAAVEQPPAPAAVEQPPAPVADVASAAPPADAARTPYPADAWAVAPVAEPPASPDWAFAPAPEAAPDPFSWAAPSDDQAETDWSTYLGRSTDDAPAAEPWAEAPEPVAPESVPQAIWMANPAPDHTEAAVGGTHHAAPEPLATASFRAPAAPEPETEPVPEPQLDAPLHVTLPATGEPDTATTSTASALESGVWQLPEPEVAGRRRRRPSTADLLPWAKRLVSAVGILLIVTLLLVAVGPKVLPYQTFFVRSGSMEPTIEVGELIFLTKVDAADLDEGDIITFERPDRAGVMITHRIVAIEQTESGKVFQTKGDANGSPDTWRVPAQGEGWRYAVGIPKLGFVFGYLNTPLARVAMLVVPAVILGLLSLIDIWKPSTPEHAARRRG